MTIYEIATGYTSVPAKVGAATEIVVEELTRAFIKNSINAKIIDMADKNRENFGLPIIEVKVPSFLVPEDASLGIVHKFKRVVYSIKLAKKLKSIVNSTDEKVVFHFHNQYNMFFFFKLSSKKTREKALIAYTVHSGIWNLDWNENADSIKKRYFQEIFCMKNADIVYVLNEKTEKNIISNLGIDKNKIVRINNGVNTDIYRPLSQTEKEIVLNKYSLSGKRVILQVGSVCDNKGQERTVNLLCELLKKHSDLMYVYAGGIVSPEYQDKIIHTATELGVNSQIRYLGMIEPGENLNELYNVARATVFPSDYEAFGMVVIESLCCGVPVLMSDSMQHIDFGKGVILFNEDNFISKAEQYIINQEYPQIFEDARINAQCNYSWDIVAKNYYDSICEFLK